MHERSVQRTSSPTAGMKPIIHQTSAADLRAENRIVKRGQVRDIETTDSELRLVPALRRSRRYHGPLAVPPPPRGGWREGQNK
jgi:hypothetical protein